MHKTAEPERAKERLPPSPFTARAKKISLPPVIVMPQYRSRIAAFPSDGTRFPCLLHHTTRGAPRTAAMKTSKLVPIVVFADLVKFHGPHFCPIIFLLYSGGRYFFRRSGPNIVYRDGLKYGYQVP